MTGLYGLFVFSLPGSDDEGGQRSGYIDNIDDRTDTSKNVRVSLGRRMKGAMTGKISG